MLSQIDTLLFPDECEVLEVDNNRYVFPIHKNGSTSLHKSGFRTLTLEEIKKLNEYISNKNIESLGIDASKPVFYITRYRSL